MEVVLRENNSLRVGRKGAYQNHYLLYLIFDLSESQKDRKPASLLFRDLYKIFILSVKMILFN